jgi:hypothetical protein
MLAYVLEVASAETDLPQGEQIFNHRKLLFDLPLAYGDAPLLDVDSKDLVGDNVNQMFLVGPANNDSPYTSGDARW